jgi:hypothetical protein
MAGRRGQVVPTGARGRCRESGIVWVGVRRDSIVGGHTSQQLDLLIVTASHGGHQIQLRKPVRQWIKGLMGGSALLPNPRLSYNCT